MILHLVSAEQTFRDRRARHCRRRRRHSGPLPPPSIPRSLTLPSFPSHPTHAAVITRSSSPRCPSAVCSVRESHENRFVRKVQIRTCNARKGRREREGKGERPFANENSLYLPKWRPQRRCKDTMARPSAAAITHITMVGIARNEMQGG